MSQKMSFNISMRRTITDPDERAIRLNQLYEIFSKRNGSTVPSRQTSTAEPKQTLADDNQPDDKYNTDVQ